MVTSDQPSSVVRVEAAATIRTRSGTPVRTLEGLGTRPSYEARPVRVSVSGTKSALFRTPQSGQHQSAGMSDQGVPAAKPSCSSPVSTS